MKGVLKKLIAIVAIVAVLGVGALVDLAVKASYEIEFVSVERLEVEGEERPDIPINCGITDGNTNVRFRIRLTRNGRSVEGHTLYIKTNRNVLSRIDTDENGEVVIDYRCYRAGNPNKVKPITLTVRDEDNSVFVFMPVEASYVLEMVLGTAVPESDMMTDEIFYDINKGGEN